MKPIVASIRHHDKRWQQRSDRSATVQLLQVPKIGRQQVKIATGYEEASLKWQAPQTFRSSCEHGTGSCPLEEEKIVLLFYGCAG
jgi:hypothetical protein